MMADSPLPPVPDIVRAAYGTLVVTDLAEARRFWVGLLGFVVTYEDSSALYLRGFDELTHHNLIVRSGPVAAAGALGYRVRSAADLALAEAYYAALNCRTERLPAGAVRGLGREGGQHSIDFYTESRIVHIALGDTHVPRFGA